MPLLLGHRGYSAKHLENSMQAFRAALEAGMNGFELDVQPTLDGVCAVLHDDDLQRTARASGILRKMTWRQLPRLRNGEEIPTLAHVLALPAALINVELKGRSGWRIALAVVEESLALERVIFSSFEHEEVLELQAECPDARCGLLYTSRQANALTGKDAARIASRLSLHLPMEAVRSRPAFWIPYSSRIALWGMARFQEVSELPFTPEILIADGF